MKVEYFPKRDASGAIVRDTGYAVLVPDGWVSTRKWLFEIAIHGMGERSQGRIEHLQNLVEGFDYDGNGTREGNPFVTADMKKSVDQYGIVMLIPTYESTEFLEPTKINFLFDQVKTRYALVDKMLITGFSLGGGAAIKFASSSAANAARVGYCVPVAATNALADASVIAKAGIPVHFFSNDNDNTVPVTYTKTMYTAINAASPLIPALMTIFRRDGHGGNNEAWSLTPPKAVGGQGFTNAAENIYEVYADIIATGPRQMKATTISTGLTPILNITEKDGLVTLDGRGSSGYLSAKLAVVSVPAGENIWGYNVIGGGTETGTIQLTKAGAYTFRLTVYPQTGYKGTPAFKDITYQFGGAEPPVKKPTDFDPVTKTLFFSDGSQEYYTSAKTNIATKLTTYVTEGGVTYTV